MFRVSTLDMENLPRTDKGANPLQPGHLFGRSVPDCIWSTEPKNLCLCHVQGLYLWPDLPRKLNTSRHLANSGLVEPEIAFANPGYDNAAPAEKLRRCLHRSSERAS